MKIYLKPSLCAALPLPKVFSKKHRALTMQALLRVGMQRFCVPLVSLRAFNPMAAPLPAPADISRLPPATPRRGLAYTRGAARRGARLLARARRGNLFFDPSSIPKDDSLAVRCNGTWGSTSGGCCRQSYS